MYLMIECKVGEDYDLFTQRIGNMALVSKELNGGLGQKSFAEKQKLLKDSPTSYTINDITKYQEWNPQAIASRQEELSLIAMKVWDIDLL